MLTESFVMPVAPGRTIEARRYAVTASKGSGEESLREITDQELAQMEEAMVAAWHAGTLREFFSERHPEWSEEEIERWTVKAEAYFSAQRN